MMKVHAIIVGPSVGQSLLIVIAVMLHCIRTFHKCKIVVGRLSPSTAENKRSYFSSVWFVFTYSRDIVNWDLCSVNPSLHERLREQASKHPLAPHIYSKLYKNNTPNAHGV